MRGIKRFVGGGAKHEEVELATLAKDYGMGLGAAGGGGRGKRGVNRLLVHIREKWLTKQRRGQKKKNSKFGNRGGGGFHEGGPEQNESNNGGWGIGDYLISGKRAQSLAKGRRRG